MEKSEKSIIEPLAIQKMPVSFLTGKRLKCFVGPFNRIFDTKDVFSLRNIPTAYFSSGRQISNYTDWEAPTIFILAVDDPNPLVIAADAAVTGRNLYDSMVEIGEGTIFYIEQKKYSTDIFHGEDIIYHYSVIETAAIERKEAMAEKIMESFHGLDQHLQDERQ